MKKILVPTDFSLNATKAVDYAVQLAKLNKASIYIIHACELVETAYGSSLAGEEERNKKIANTSFENLEMIKRSIEETEGVVVDTQLYDGLVTDTILIAAKEHDVDLIIMGTLGITGIADKIFGSKTAALIGKTDIPLLAIPLEYDWSAPKKLLFAANDPDEAAKHSRPLFEIAKAFEAEVEVVVFTDEDAAVAVEYDEHSKEAVQLEETLRSKYAGVPVHHEHLSGHRFEETINDYIHVSKIDLIAMITHKRGFIKSIFNRSMTKKMAYHTKVPLLAIPAAGQ